MDNVKIKFYTLGSKRLDLSKFNSNDIDLSKKVNTSKEFNEALSAVTQKDINALDIKISSIQKDITKKLATNGTLLTEKLDFNIKQVDSLINKVEEIISNLIISKNNNKVGLFSSNKKLKKSNLKKLDDSIEYLSKCQTQLISMKNEYNKLASRNTFIEGVINPIKSFEGENIAKEDPIERTINFYMNNLN